MSITSTSLAAIAQLSTAERIQLVEDIWDTIAAHPEAVVLSETQTHELDRRLAALQQNPDAGALWQEVRQRVQKRK